MCIFFTSVWTFINFFIKKKLFLKLKNCVTELCWFLPNINMNFFFHPRRFTLFLCLRNSLLYESPHPVVKAHTHFVSLPCGYGTACDLGHQARMPIRDRESEASAVKHQAPDGIHFDKGSPLYCPLPPHTELSFSCRHWMFGPWVWHCTALCLAR